MSLTVRSMTLSSKILSRTRRRVVPVRSSIPSATTSKAIGIVVSALYRSATSYTKDRSWPVWTKPRPGEHPRETMTPWTTPYSAACAADSAWLIGSEASKSSTRYSRRVQATPVRLEFSLYTSRTLAPSRPRSCCMVSPSTLSPLKRMQYISRATRSRFCGEETRAACSTSSRVDVASRARSSARRARRPRPPSSRTRRAGSSPGGSPTSRARGRRRPAMPPEPGWFPGRCAPSGPRPPGALRSAPGRERTSGPGRGAAPSQEPAASWSSVSPVSPGRAS